LILPGKDFIIFFQIPGFDMPPRPTNPEFTEQIIMHNLNSHKLAV
jgi:hypothetical protein